MAVPKNATSRGNWSIGKGASAFSDRCAKACDAARKGYALNAMCYSFNEAENRAAFLADEEASDVPDFTEHGLGVTSAVLFGPIEPEATAERPYAPVDHHRVLDAKIDGEDPYELYRTLGHVETVLLSRQYQFINLSLGPDLPIEDQDGVASENGK